MAEKQEPTVVTPEPEVSLDEEWARQATPDADAETETETEAPIEAETETLDPADSTETETKTEPAEGEQSSAPSAEDVWAGLTEAQQQALREIEHDRDSFKGRVPGLQRAHAQMTRDLAEARAELSRLSERPAPAGKDAPSDRDVSAAMETPESWAEFVEEFPVIAEAVEARLGGVSKSVEDAMTTRLSAVEKRIVDRIEQASAPAEFKAWLEQETNPNILAADIGRQQTYYKIHSVHADWAEQIASPEFHGWLDTLPHDIAETIRHSNEDATIIRALDDFKGATTTTPTQTDDPPKDTLDDPRARAIREKRAAQLAGSVEINGRNAPPTPATDAPEGDLDSIWEQTRILNERKQKRNAASGFG